MIRILLDADASIKLTKIGIIETFVFGFEVILTNDVYDEHVIAGLSRNYEDAKIMKKLVTKGDVFVADVTEKPSAFDKLTLGRGEKSVINYYMGDNNIDLIVSDDEAFLKVLDRFSIPFTPVAGVILMCVTHELISKDKGFRYLESLKPMIKDEHMFYIKSKIEELS
ncbi:MAG: hypothetical protein Q7J10_08200 [Methanosarcinaceae archaeon]|nr:hypothetical protein [Methanosarcinaceae archaeon]